MEPMLQIIMDMNLWQPFGNSYLNLREIAFKHVDIGLKSWIWMTPSYGLSTSYSSGFTHAILGLWTILQVPFAAFHVK